MIYCSIPEEVNALEFKNLNVDEIKAFLNCEIVQVNFVEGAPNLIIKLEDVNYVISDKSFVVVDRYNRLKIYKHDDFLNQFRLKESD